MDQIDKYLYQLKAGEPVKVELVPYSAAQHLVVAALDGRTVLPSASGDLSFQFTFSGEETVLRIEAEFVDPQPNSRYDIFITASSEEKKQGPTLDPQKNAVEIKFRTRTGPPH